jgi:hypothetical protein
MTDDNDLVKRLRDGCNLQQRDGEKAADRIEALTEQLEAARLDAKEAEAYSVWLEGKMRKAEKALYQIAGKAPYADDPYDIARAALAELKGDKQ